MVLHLGPWFMEKISADMVTTIDYTLLLNGTEVESSELTYLHGHKNIILGLENAMDGLSIGDEKTVNLSADQAYGDYQPELVQKASKGDFPPEQEIKVGMEFQTETNMGIMVFTVKAIEGGVITMDGNHPMAGKDLTFNIKVKEIRKATQEEISHGHIHMANHDHH